VNKPLIDHTIALPRQAGKTTLLIGAAAATGRPIICATEQRADNVEALARKYGLRVEAHSAMSYLNRSRDTGLPDVLVDDARDVLDVLLGARVAMLTVTRGSNA